MNDCLRKCLANLNLISARAFGTGGVVLKPYVFGGEIYTDIIPQERFFVIEQHGEIITKAGFIAETLSMSDNKKYSKFNKYYKNNSNKKFARIEYHTLNSNGDYIIENKAIAFEKEDGSEIELKNSPWGDMPVKTIINGNDNAPIKRMLFSFVKCPADNKRDFSSIYGVPVTYGQDKIINMIRDLLNEIPDEYKNKKAFIGADDLLFDKNSKLPESGLYRLFRGTSGLDQDNFWEIFSPEIRHTSYFEGLDYLFGLLEKAICVNKGMLTDLSVNNATATAIKRSSFDTFSAVNAMRRNLEKAFEQLAYSFEVIGEAFDLCNNDDFKYKLKFDWDYRLLESTSETWQQMLDGFNAGAVTQKELRAYLFGEEKEISESILDEQAENAQTSELDERAVEKARADEGVRPYGETGNTQTPVGEERRADEGVRPYGETVAKYNVTFGSDGREDPDLTKIQDDNNNQDVKIYSVDKVFVPAGISEERFNPFKRDSWNMNEQAKIYKDNPEIARYLREEAGF